MEEFRVFPRYHLKKIKINIQLDIYGEKNFTPTSVGLGGMSLKTNIEIPFKEVENKLIHFHLAFLKQKYPLTGFITWTTWDINSRSGKFGIKLIFNNLKNYHDYLALINALDKLRTKKNNTDYKN